MFYCGKNSPVRRIPQDVTTAYKVQLAQSLVSMLAVSVKETSVPTQISSLRVNITNMLAPYYVLGLNGSFHSHRYVLMREEILAIFQYEMIPLSNHRNGSNSNLK